MSAGRVHQMFVVLLLSISAAAASTQLETQAAQMVNYELANSDTADLVSEPRRLLAKKKSPPPKKKSPPPPPPKKKPPPPPPKCPGQTVRINGTCQCPFSGQYYQSKNGLCLCTANKVVINSKCQCPSNKTWNGNKCVPKPAKSPKSG